LGVVSVDVTSLTTADNVVAEEAMLRVEPLLPRVPETPEEMERLRRSLMGNPMVVGRLVSEDVTTTAVYVPLEANRPLEGGGGQVRAVGQNG
jgi:hypothetical protein